MTKMPTLCAFVGPLPEKYRSFLNADGDLQVGDSLGLEAQWVISMITDSSDCPYPESEWSRSQIEEDEYQPYGQCFYCGAEDISTIRGLCFECR